MRRFDKLLNQVLQEALGHVQYRPPEQVSEKMADFYLLSMLMHLGGPASHRTDQLEYELKQAQQVLLPHLRSHLLLKAGYSIICETAHFYTMTYWKDDSVNSKDRVRFAVDAGLHLELALLLLRYGRADLMPKPEVATTPNCYECARAGLTLFRSGEEYRWEGDYGGEPWVQACRAWLSLYHAHTIPDLNAYIDKLYSTEHNTGSLLDKNDEYWGAWVYQLLDLKSEANEPEELLPHASAAMQKLGRMVLLNATRRAWSGNRQDVSTAFINRLFARIKQSLPKEVRTKVANHKHKTILSIYTPAPNQSYLARGEPQWLASIEIESGVVTVNSGQYDPATNRTDRERFSIVDKRLFGKIMTRINRVMPAPA